MYTTVHIIKLRNPSSSPHPPAWFWSGSPGCPSLVCQGLSHLMDTAGPEMTGQSARPVRRPIAPAHRVGHGLRVPFEVRPRHRGAADFFRQYNDEGRSDMAPARGVIRQLPGG